MQVLCKASNTGSDVRCNICGQGFLVYWTRSSASERAARRNEILETLRAHHAGSDAHAAHPEAAFNLPDWGGAPQFSAAALIGNAPRALFAAA